MTFLTSFRPKKEVLSLLSPFTIQEIEKQGGGETCPSSCRRNHGLLVQCSLHCTHNAQAIYLLELVDQEVLSERQFGGLS